MKSERKITVLVTPELLARAQRAAKADITGTVPKGLELLAAADAYDRLLKLRGKVQFSVELKKLRLDRR
jgi:hypothetical protein